MSENCNSECQMAQRIMTLEADNSRHKDTHSKIYDRLSALERENAVQNAKYDAIMEKLERMDAKNDRTAGKIESLDRTATKQAQTIDELNERGKNNQARLRELESKPGENWKLLVGAIITGAVGAIIGFLTAVILPG